MGTRQIGQKSRSDKEFVGRHVDETITRGKQHILVAYIDIKSAFESCGQECIVETLDVSRFFSFLLQLLRDRVLGLSRRSVW